ncbi:hypothetical protein PGT21_002181 [Puccinia graminis f. sp. tritici]|uniref:Uncharacterized protein n=1 Tax=Puccinia graminis f. sp. tritici TaxID=56615 RepID=A0A5B0MAG6_PUCGR|nr:hypothetical protein PGT21_002181 [Puccinia graminis f. sp. tritici]
MFLVDWCQQSCFIYAVLIMTLLPSVQLLESRKHTLMQRRQGNEPPQKCDTVFGIINGLATCKNSNRDVYSCDYGDCPGKGHPIFQFFNCQSIDADTDTLYGEAVTVYPYDYSTVVNYIKVHNSRGTEFGFPYKDNPQRLTCNNCRKFT